MEESDELIEPIDETSCKRLIASTRFGRLAVVVEGRPRIVVLNHAVIGGDVMLRTAPDSLLARLTAERPVDVVYEVDSAFPVARSGWSVIATGRLDRERDATRVAAARAAITAWVHGDRDTVFRLDVERFTGRRVGPL
jgi:nitroimidazol reductase NimA-like FMN-containing flavoprotein (pyridoxamine 5'-phosphate oxidase superfamily)